MTGPLRVVVVVDDPVVPASVARAIDRVADAPVDLVGVHVHPAGRTSGRDVVSLVDRVERLLYRPTPAATAPVDLRRSCPELTLDPSRGGSADVLLDLTADGVDPQRAFAAAPTIWSLRYGRDAARLGASAFVPEYLAGSEAGVCELVEQQQVASRVIYRSVSAVDRLSPARTRNEAAWKAAEFPARMLTARAAGRRVPVGSGTTPERPGAPPHPRPVALVGRMLGRGLREVARRVGRRPTWFVAVRAGRAEQAAGDGWDPAGFHPLDAPPGRFYADPFVVARPEGGAHVFVEDGPLDGGPARLSVLTLDADGAQQAPAHVVLERPTHLSYPFVFEDEGEWYLLPETAGTGTVELLRARRFPWDWEPHAVLLRDVRAWDPTLLRHDGRYWLFVTMAAPGVRPSDELCLYSADSLTGPWRPHPRNPVVSDARRARPAGRILADQGRLVRPSQDGSGAYGRRIVLNRIDVLTPDDYQETPIGAIEPGWLPGVVRTHTYTADGGLSRGRCRIQLTFVSAFAR